jgi:hypothetical protein
MVNKTPDIMEHLLDRDPSIVFLSETWLKSNRNNVTSLVKDYGYVLLHNIRKNREKDTGGGVGILMKMDLKHKRVAHKQFSSFEHIIIRIPVADRTSLLLVSIYRVLFVSNAVFLDEIVTLFEMLVTRKENFILAGDVNIHMDEDYIYANKFKDILDTFNMVQHVNFPTHKQGHTLDIVVTFGDNPIITSIVSNEYDLSHHFLIDFHAAIIPEAKQEKEITYRKLKNIDPETFINNVSEKMDLSSESFGDNMRTYNKVLRETLDEHAPVKSKTIKVVPNAPWFDGEYASLRKQRRKAEKQYKKSQLPSDKEKYRSLRQQTTQLAHEKKCSYYGEKLEGTNNKVLYSTIKKLLDDEPEVVLPESTSDIDLANSFLNFFTKKIEKIRDTFTKDSRVVVEEYDTVLTKLSTFDVATEDEIRQIVLSFGIKCSPDDPVPSAILKTYSDIFIPIWLKLVNMSLEQGTMDCLKNAVLLPLIKQLDSIMDKENFKNYRPVSNLLFIGKLIERIVSIRLNKHMTINDLHSDFQHGYKKGHSTETLLLKVVNELLISCDKNLPSIVLLLDLSAAFDTVDQSKLLDILKHDIGIEGVALKWFESFLKGRTQKVKIGNSYSDESDLDYGVAQGSVLGPDLFNIYARSLKKYVAPASFSIFGFADDHQLLKTFLPFLQVYALDGDINNCFRLITEWMNYFFLRLNAGKTKILVILPPSLRNTVLIQGTFIDGKCIRFVHSAKNLGVILDDELSFKEQITKVVKSCFLSIRKLCKIKAFLTFEQLRTAVSALVFSKMDYCNSLYFGINATLLMKLQYVQNSAARLVRKRNHFYGSTVDVIRHCHWLRIKERIIFKICLIVRKCLNGTAPHCLSGMLKHVSSTRTTKLVQFPYISSFGNRCFARVGPKLWNLLPANVRAETEVVKFKTLLKTFLFDGFQGFEQKLTER